jgi:hypothetical protein
MAIAKNSNLIPAVCKIYFATLEDVESVLSTIDRFHLYVTFNNGKAWNEIYFTPGTAEFQEKQKENEAGDLIEQSLKFNFPGEDDTNMAALDSILNRPALVKMQFSTGVSKIIGDLTNGAKLSQTNQVSSKATGSQFEFSCNATYRACWVTS